MRACIQRVTEAKVTVDNETVGKISEGLLVLLGVSHDDGPKEARTLAEKIVGLRIFEDQAGQMNRSLREVSGAMLVVSQFTLMADCRRGRRPSFVDAASPELAEQLYELFVKEVKSLGTATETGRFRADMQVSLTNDGPVTINVDTRA